MQLRHIFFASSIAPNNREMIMPTLEISDDMCEKYKFYMVCRMRFFAVRYHMLYHYEKINYLRILNEEGWHV